jgi:hypothetical protein
LSKINKSILTILIGFLIVLACAGTVSAHPAQCKMPKYSVSTITETKYLDPVMDDDNNKVSYDTKIERVYEVTFRQVGHGSHKHWEKVRGKEVAQLVTTIFSSDDESIYVLNETEGGFGENNHRTAYSMHIRSVIDKHNLCFLKEKHTAEYIYDHSDVCKGNVIVTWSGYPDGCDAFQRKYR